MSPGAHRLAWLEVVDDRPVVFADLVEPGTVARMVAKGVPFSEGDVRGDIADPFHGFTRHVTCGCEDRWSVDLIAVLENRPQVPLPARGDDFPGVSFKRPRA